jgi:hypothetical protein
VDSRILLGLGRYCYYVVFRFYLIFFAVYDKHQVRELFVVLAFCVDIKELGDDGEVFGWGGEERGSGVDCCAAAELAKPEAVVSEEDVVDFDEPVVLHAFNNRHPVEFTGVLTLINCTKRY